MSLPFLFLKIIYPLLVLPVSFTLNSVLIFNKRQHKQIDDSMLLGCKNQYCENDYTTKCNLQIQCDTLSTEHHPIFHKIPSSKGRFHGGLQSQLPEPGIIQLRTGEFMSGITVHWLLCPILCSLQSHTFAMKIPASMMALMCLNQPEFSSPHRKSLMEGDLSSHTAR